MIGLIRIHMQYCYWFKFRIENVPVIVQRFYHRISYCCCFSIWYNLLNWASLNVHRFLTICKQNAQTSERLLYTVSACWKCRNRKLLIQLRRINLGKKVFFLSTLFLESKSKPEKCSILGNTQINVEYPKDFSMKFDISFLLHPYIPAVKLHHGVNEAYIRCTYKHRLWAIYFDRFLSQTELFREKVMNNNSNGGSQYYSLNHLMTMSIDSIKKCHLSLEIHLSRCMECVKMSQQY